MIKDVKDYINTVSSRLSKAFDMEPFSVEDELEFWSLSAEHMSRKELPSFSDIASWIDILYRAPLHFVYRKEGEFLLLARRHMFVENLLKKDKKDPDSAKYTLQEKESIQDFENQIQNLEKKRSWDDSFRGHGISSHTIGNCEHIPIYDKKGEIWGVYVVGPYTKSPDCVEPKLSIVGRILSEWLIKLDKKEKKSQKEYETKISSLVENLGSGALNTKGLAQLVLLYIINSFKAEQGAIVEYSEGKPILVTHKNLAKEFKSGLLATDSNSIYNYENGKYELSTSGAQLFKDSSRIPFVISFEGEYTNGYIWLLLPEVETIKQRLDGILKSIADMLGRLLTYRDDNYKFSVSLIDTYYEMLREIESQRSKTRFHTPRLIAFVERFAMLFGLEDDETESIKLTAKLHDIGYVGAAGLSKDTSIESELVHPLSGATMVEQLPIPKEVIDGIKTHHEWVNGKGSPQGLEADKIPWTGKIICVFEYVVDFIESNRDSKDKSDEEFIELLSKNLIERADRQFDMVLIPTAIQLIQMLGWQNCLTLGVDEGS